MLLPYTDREAQPAPAADPRCRGRRRRSLQTLLEKDPPYGAQVAFEPQVDAAGWNAPALAPWLEQSLARASEAAFGAPPAYMGEGGTIPFMAMLGEKFPQAQFVVTGVLGPHSNAHGPNEFLHIPTGRRVTRSSPRSSPTTARGRQADSAGRPCPPKRGLPNRREARRPGRQCSAPSYPARIHEPRSQPLAPDRQFARPLRHSPLGQRGWHRRPSRRSARARRHPARRRQGVGSPMISTGWLTVSSAAIGVGAYRDRDVGADAKPQIVSL